LCCHLEQTEEFRVDHDNDTADEDDGACFIIDHVTGCRSAMLTFHVTYLTAGLTAVLATLYVAYSGYALYYDFGDEPSIRLLSVMCLVTTLVVTIWALSRLFLYLRPKLNSLSTYQPISHISKHHTWIIRFVSQYNP